MNGGGGFTPLNKKSPKLDPTISTQFPQRPLAPSLGDESTMDEMLGVIQGMRNWKAVGPDSFPAELLKLDHSEFIRCFHVLFNVRERQCARTGNVPQQWKDATIKVLHKKRGFACYPFRQSVAESCRFLPQQLLRGRGDTPRGAVRLLPSTLDSQQSFCSSCADCKNSDELGKSPCTFSSSTSRKHMTSSTESSYGLCSHASVCQRRC